MKYGLPSRRSREISPAKALPSSLSLETPIVSYFEASQRVTWLGLENHGVFTTRGSVERLIKGRGSYAGRRVTVEHNSGGLAGFEPTDSASAPPFTEKPCP